MAKAVSGDTPKNEDGTDAPGFFTHPRGHIRDRVILHETKDAPKEGQFVGLNGFGFLIQYNKELDLPRPVLEMLQSRIETAIIKNPDGTEIVRNIPRFNLTIVKRNVGGVEEDGEVGTFTCEVCNRSFDRKAGLASHMRSHDKG